MFQRHMDERNRQQILLNNQDLLYGDFSQYRDSHGGFNVNVKKLFLDNKKRRERLELKKMEAKALLKEEQEKHM